ncbi:uncharacterized protein LOC113345752 [Papaver somniferum]|uniref:uncharacterized protein LOC113345752 n=1 Tax=Papaver somniferum TaxID=3469 RepID=UPI000E6F5904|nr:uncharacterized protein LOC113345752 [Papaver somniferum]
MPTPRWPPVSSVPPFSPPTESFSIGSVGFASTKASVSNVIWATTSPSLTQIVFSSSSFSCSSISDMSYLSEVIVPPVFESELSNAPSLAEELKDGIILEPMPLAFLPPEPVITDEDFEKEVDLMMLDQDTMTDAPDMAHDPVKTMVDVETVRKYTHHLPFDKWIIIPSVGKSSGLAFGFIEKSSIEILGHSHNMIHILCDVTPAINNCVISFIYGSLNLSGMKDQWSFLSDMHDNNNNPWTLLGDFNFILTDSDKQGGNPSGSFPPKFVVDKLFEMNMNEVYSFGNRYTWCNRRFRNPNELIFEKLDRAFMNDKWVSVLPKTRAINLRRIYSDHCPVLVNLFHGMSKVNIPFKFFKCWQLNPEFKEVLNNSWTKRVIGSPCFVVVNKLKTVKSDLCKWNINSFGHIKITIARLNSEIERLQSLPYSPQVGQYIFNYSTNLITESIIAIPTPQEVKETVFNLASWSSPGPDGFQAGFFQDNWDIVQTEVISHSAFVANRQIHDNVVITHEILHSFKRKKKNNKNGFLAIKLDLSKAFDRLEWPFILAVFEKLGFSKEWCQMISQCINTVSYSVLVNGSPSDAFFPSRGIRQGDFLSPYIFILCMEVLSKLLLNAEENNLIQGFRFKKDSPSISHLFFVDDCMLFLKASVTYARNLLKVIDIFAKASGEAINFDNSGFITSNKMHHKHVKLPARTLKMKFLSNSEKYLGSPLFIGKDKSNSFNFLVDNLYSRLSTTKKTNINVAGRTIVTKHVLSSLAVYHMGCFPLPKKITSKIDSIQRCFWWSKKNPNRAAYFRSWGDIGKSKSNGGLGIRNTYALNRVFIWNLNPHVSSHASYTDYVFVNDLMDLNNCCWNEGVLSNLFSADEVSRIKAIRFNLNQRDSLMWSHTINGDFTIKSAYKVYMKDFPSPEDTCFWRKIWEVDCLPKIKYFLWKIFAYMLHVNSLVCFYNPEVDVRCPLYHQYEETVIHLFIHCYVAKHIWFGLSLLHLVSVDLDWIDDYFLYWHETHLGTSPFKVNWPSIGSIVMWYIWKLRCDVLFRNISIYLNKVILEVQRMINTYISPRNFSNASPIVGLSSRTEVEHFMFIDGSYKDYNMGLGVIWCDIAGNVKGLRSDFGLMTDAVGG